MPRSQRGLAAGGSVTGGGGENARVLFHRCVLAGRLPLAAIATCTHLGLAIRCTWRAGEEGGQEPDLVSVCYRPPTPELMVPQAFRVLDWFELPEAERESLRVLGCDDSTWEDGEYFPSRCDSLEKVWRHAAPPAPAAPAPRPRQLLRCTEAQAERSAPCSLPWRADAELERAFRARAHCGKSGITERCGGWGQVAAPRRSRRLGSLVQATHRRCWPIAAPQR